MQHTFFTKSLFLFALLFILSVPFPHNYIPDIAGYLHPLFEALVKFTGSHIFNIHHPYTSQLISDSTGLYIHVFNIAVISVLISLIWIITDKKKQHSEKLFYWFVVIVSYYLALQLFEYGFSKIFKWQFYLPEPNTLFTTVGNTYRDLMYWNTMGLSRPYTIFAGATEIIAACLLLFKRTRLAGALLAFFVLINVVAINFSYDISVKILSCFLVLLSILIIAPYAKQLFSFFWVGESNYKRENGSMFSSSRSKLIYQFIKTFVIIYILFSTLSTYFITKNFNDDAAKRPLFHGAYDVPVFVRNNDTLLPLLNTLRWKRAFVHRRDYFITQDMKDEMQDYALITDTINHVFILTREDDKQQFKLNYRLNPDSTVNLNGIIDSYSLSLQLKPIDLKQLPALQNEFHWTIDN